MVRAVKKHSIASREPNFVMSSRYYNIQIILAKTNITSYD